jgi:hypothetical protein
MEDELFARPEQRPTIICYRYRHGLRPNRVINHLKRAQHRLSAIDATQLKQAIHP